MLSSGPHLLGQKQRCLGFACTGALLRSLGVRARAAAPGHGAQEAVCTVAALSCP